MKFQTAIVTLFALPALAMPLGESSDAHNPNNTWTQVSLTAPLNWIAGPHLFPAEVISGYHADYKNYTAQKWAAHVLAICQGFEAANSSITYSAINSGTPKNRVWFGYCFRGNETTQADYARDNGVQDSIAYTQCS